MDKLFYYTLMATKCLKKYQKVLNTFDQIQGSKSPSFFGHITLLCSSKKQSTRSGTQNNYELGDDKTDNDVDSAFEVDSDEDKSDQSVASESTVKCGFRDEVLESLKSKTQSPLCNCCLAPLSL